MIKIETRMNETFEFGYPYNTQIDEYFEPLTDEYIKNNGLTPTEVLSINNHKQKVKQFDNDLVEYISKISEFIFNFNKSVIPLQNEYDTLQYELTELQHELHSYQTRSDEINDKYEYLTTNLDSKHQDLLVVNELLENYNSQLTHDSYIFDSHYIEKTNNDIDNIKMLLLDINNDIDLTKSSLSETITKFVSAKSKIKHYKFSDILLKDMYETWLKTPNTSINNKLILYFKSDYDAIWTYGTSLLFDKNLKYVKSYELDLDNIFLKISSFYNQQLNFEHDIEMKQKSIIWVKNKINIDIVDFKKYLLMIDKDILLTQINDKEILLNNIENKLNKIVTKTSFDNYLKYREIVLLLQQYKNTHIGKLDEDIIYDFNNQLSLLLSDFNNMSTILNQSTYWELYYESKILQEVLTNLSRKLELIVKKIDNNYHSIDKSNSELKHHIEFYNNQKKSIEEDIKNMNTLKSSIYDDKAELSDKITIYHSEIEEKEYQLDKLYKHYIVLFENRILFYSDKDTTIEDTVLLLFDNNLNNELRSTLETLVSYDTNIIWWNDDKDKLFSYYHVMVDKLDTILNEQWSSELHPILNKYLYSYYGKYFDTHLKKLYAHIHNFIVTAVYDENIISVFNEYKEKLNIELNRYIDITDDNNTKVMISIDMFDYDKIIYYDLLTTHKDNILKSFERHLNIIKSFIIDNNTLFKEKKQKIEIAYKINKIWDLLELTDENN